eukprot:c19553_g1_i1 orf=394-687(-)
MDWEGQKLVEQMMQYALMAAAVVAFVVGYVMSSFKITMMTYGGAVLIILLIVLPDWPYFNRHPLHWAEPKVTDPQSSKAHKSRSQVSTKKPVKSTKK